MRPHATLSLVLVLVLLAGGALPSSASWFSIKKKRLELQRIQTHLREEKDRLTLANRREQAVAHQLRDAQERLSGTREQLHQLASHLRFTEGEIRVARATLKRLQEMKFAKELQFSQRMLASHRSGEMNVAALMFGSESMTDFLNRLNFMGVIVRSDVTLLKEIRAKNEAVRTQERLLGNKYREIVQIKRRMNEQHLAQTHVEGQREQLLDQTRRERQSIAHQVVELEESNEKLEAELQDLIRREQARRRQEAGPIFSGAFAWPSGSTRITSPFGWRRHPIMGTLRFHTGVDIAAEHGSTIHAAGDGHVIYAGWYGGYGNAAVIDHGAGVSTLYAHCSALYVRSEQNVQKGQTIAATGSTGMSNGPHLHFEVRHNGTPVDPMGRF